MGGVLSAFEWDGCLVRTLGFIMKGMFMLASIGTLIKARR